MILSCLEIQGDLGSLTASKNPSVCPEDSIEVESKSCILLNIQRVGLRVGRYELGNPSDANFTILSCRNETLVPVVIKVLLFNARNVCISPEVTSIVILCPVAIPCNQFNTYCDGAVVSVSVLSPV